MPQYNRAELGRMGTESGFVRDTFEKVLRLKEILKFLNEDKFLREHLLLKGGTAINLTVFNLPRLSVDIDIFHNLIRRRGIHIHPQAFFSDTNQRILCLSLRV